MSEVNECYDQNLELQSENAIDLSEPSLSQPILQNNGQFLTVTHSLDFLEGFVNEIELHFSDLLIRLDAGSVKEEKKKFKLRKTAGGKECAICQTMIRKSEFFVKVDTKIPKLNCKHVFHQKCLSQWVKHKKNCPMCREEVV